MGRTRLYLDTARLGRMSAGAERAHASFARLGAEEAGSTFFDRFLTAGAGEWDEEDVCRFPGLAGFRGIGALKAQLRRIAGGQAGLPLLLANRSAQLMRLVAGLFFGPCRDVLVTDLGWPPYQSFLTDEATKRGRRVTTIPVLRGVLEDGWGEDDIVRAVGDGFRGGASDGVFLTTVSHLGVRLPVGRIVRELQAARELRRVVTDGSQEFCHVPGELDAEYCDFYLAGSHKWLGALHPLGLGFYGRRRSRSVVDQALSTLLEQGGVDDPLLRFTEKIEQGASEIYSETVNLVPLFTCAGAASDAMAPRADSLAGRVANAERVALIAKEAGWRPLAPVTSLRTGILLLRSRGGESRSAADLRGAFARHGIALSAYDGGFVRLSLPSTSLDDGEADLLQCAFAAQ